MGTSAPSMGRITGSASIETLVRVGIEKENGLGPESKMVVLHDFTPCVDDELEVKRGQVRHGLKVIPRLRECCRQDQVEVVTKNRNKIHQTQVHLLADPCIAYSVFE